MQHFGPRVSVTGARRQLEQSFATTAAVAGLAPSQTVQTAETVNQLAEKSQQCFGHIQLGILTSNQQVALVQEQVDYLWTFQQLTMLCVLLVALYCMLLLLLWNSTII